MSQIVLPKIFKVEIIESERGWGSKIDDILYFDSEDEAVKFVKSYNDEHITAEQTDWYMVANYCGQVK